VTDIELGINPANHEEEQMASNAELHRKMDEGLTKGDMDSVRELIAEDVVNHVPGRNPLAGVHQGRDAFFERLQQIVDLTGGNVSVEHRDILESEEHSVALSTMSATREGKTFKGDIVDICRWRDGRVIEEWVIPFDQHAFDAFLS
jgi:uncharacterized protein